MISDGGDAIATDLPSVVYFMACQKLCP